MLYRLCVLKFIVKKCGAYIVKMETIILSSDSECPVDTLDYMSDAGSSETDSVINISSEHSSDYTEENDASNEDTDTSSESSDSEARGVAKSSE